MISTKTHGVLDYLIGALLVIGTYVLELGFGGPQVWVPMWIGFALITYSLITNYDYGIVKIISLRLHLVLDVIAGLLLASSPWLFTFRGTIYWPHVAVGLLLILMALFSSRHPNYIPRKDRPLSQQ